MPLITREIVATHDLVPLAAAQPDRYPGLLASAAQGNARARYDILFAFPQDLLRLDAPGIVRDGRGDSSGTHFLQALDAAWQAARLPRDKTCGLPFRGGWLLYLGYELAAEIEPTLSLPMPAAEGIPVALALRCPAAIIVDHQRQRTVLVAEQGRADLIEAMQRDLDTTPREPTESFERNAILVETIKEDAPEDFLQNVSRIQAHLRAGDVFQVNISREWRLRYRVAPTAAALHVALRRSNPAPFAGLLQQPGWAIASSSPERLVEVRGNVVQARPIAGTYPRLPNDDDIARMRELVTHPKERAEHVMLIDLVRNDLGRVCTAGSVVVDEVMTVESYTHVHHIVSNVRGILEATATPGRVIAAVFPGGTITGCPKVRCMQIIAQLERVGRGAYTGSLGYLNRDGDLDLNILIRSMVLRGDQASFRAGAGIVADSVAERELDETRAKARGLLRASGA